MFLRWSQLCLRSLTAGPDMERSRSRIWASDTTPRSSPCSKMSTHTSALGRRYPDCVCWNWKENANARKCGQIVNWMFVFRWGSVAGRAAANPLSPWPSSAWWTCLRVQKNIDAYILLIGVWNDFKYSGKKNALFKNVLDALQCCEFPSLLLHFFFHREDCNWWHRHRQAASADPQVSLVHHPPRPHPVQRHHPVHWTLLMKLII